MSTKRERIEVVGEHIIHWSFDKEAVLQEFVSIFTEVFEGSSYSAKRNTTPGEMCIDIFWGSEEDIPRVAHVWPKTRTETMDLCVQTELVERIKAKVDLPMDSDIKDGRYPNWRTFKKIKMSKAIEILSAIAGKNNPF